MKSYLFYLLATVFLFFTSPENFASSFHDFPKSWSGDTAFFTFIQDQEMIQLNAPAEAGEAFVFSESTVLEDATWEITVHFDFNPSSSNYLQIFFATDGEKEFDNGFFLVAGTSSDNISLWQRKYGEDILLINGIEGRLNDDPASAKIKVSRKKGGYWKLETDTGTGWQNEGEAQSSLGFPVQFFGVSCHFTKTRCDKFLIGPLSVSGEAYRDTVPPGIEDLEIVNGHTLKFLFSEAVADEGGAPVIEVLGHGVQSVSEIKYTDENKVAVLRLNNVLPSLDDGQMLVSGWCDANGACLQDTIIGFSYLAPQVTGLEAENNRTLVLSFNQDIPDGILLNKDFIFPGENLLVTAIEQEEESVFQLSLSDKLPDAKEVDCFIEKLLLSDGDTIPEGPYQVYYHEAAPYDIVITEVMHIPSPAALLPEVEYIELFNRSALPVDLKNMVLGINGNGVELAEYMLFPGDYVVLVGDDSAGFSNELLISKLPALTNSGGDIVLRAPSGVVTTAIRYPAILAGQSFKQKGGWSMEIVDPDNLSGNDINWVYCQNDSGGTPGYRNSLDGANPDLISPDISASWLENDSTLVLDLGEPLALSSFNPEDFQNENPELGIESVKVDSIFGDVVFIIFQDQLIPDQVENFSFPGNITDLAGNFYSGPEIISFGFPGKVDSFDVVINELLFDPPSGGCDYVELFNKSQHIISLDSICLARNGSDGSPEKLISLSDRIKWLLPGEYLCLAEDIGWVRDFFYCKKPANLRETDGLPNFVSEGGTVFLTYLNGAIIDRFDYSPDLHFALLSDSKGVALERTTVSKPTDDPAAWHSAASTVGYGTPTWKNSQAIEENQQTTNDLFRLSPGIFTPNLDGVDDQLIISYSFDSPGEKGTFVVFDAEGREVKSLVNNQSLGTSGQITWDGTTDDHSQAPPGIYIIWAQIFNLGGQVQKQKKTCVLGVSGN